MTFRILSLDGSGPWSLVQVMTLIDLYRSGGALLSGHQVLRDFDLVVANSGGAVVLGGLLKDLPLGDIQKYFEDPALRHALFPRARRGLGARLLGRISGIGPRYSSARKLDGLRRILNDGPGEPGIGDLTVDALKVRTRLPTQIMITAFDYDRRREVVFRSNVKSRAADFALPPIATLAEAIHASTTAPLDFFDAPAAVSRGRRCWDGAIAGLGNPVLAGIAEALANGIDPDAIQVLSIGAGSVILPTAVGNEDEATAKLVQRRRAPSRTGDLKKLAETLLDDPPDTASLMAHLALGQPVPREPGHLVTEGTLVRMNPLVQPIRVPSGWARPAGLIEADDGSDEFLRLRRLPMDALGEDDIELIRKFCTLWHNDAVVNQPIRANADTLECEIGHRVYGEAKAQWQALMLRTGSNSAPIVATPATIATQPPPRSMAPARISASKTL
ncbi:MAG: patatin [Alphaproteobacteria bacterium]|nr:patatin [Alphaproteobacteria bacterium]